MASSTSSRALSKEEINAKKRELAQLLAEKQRRRESNPLEYAEMHAKQQEATLAKHAIRVLFWGNRVGKTEWGAMETARYVLNKHPTKEIKLPIEVWAASPSYDTQEETTQAALMRYIPMSEVRNIEKLRGGIFRKIVLMNGSTITFKSYEQGREKFQGAGKRLIWFDEEPPQSIYDECFVRVKAGQPLDTIMTMTPVNGMTWVYNRLYSATSEDIFISTAGWRDNPWLTEDQLAQMSRGLSPEMLRVRRDGEFISRVGGVCNWFDRNLNIKHYDSYDPRWQYYEVFDGGWSDPAAWLLCAVDQDNSIHIVNGFRKKELLASDIVEQRNIRKGGLTIITGWTDNDNPRLQLELANAGMPLQAVVKKVPRPVGQQQSGVIKAWDEYLAEKMAEYGAVNKVTGKPRLFISDNLIDYDDSGNAYNWLMSEIENLKWQEKGDMVEHETVPKWDDHRKLGHHFDGVRALAYFLVSYMQRPPQYTKQSNGRARQRQVDFTVGI